MRCSMRAAFLVLVLGSQVLAQEQIPFILPASNEGQAAISGFRVPEGMQVKLFAAEPMLANPVAFGIDEQGRIFVCETFRQYKGVEDNRRHMNWLETELSLQSVDDRLAMFQKFLGPDLSSVSTQPDRLRLLTDTDGDGVADKATVFTEGFHAPLDGTGAGVLSYRGQVFYTCIPELYAFRDRNADGVSDEKTILHHGFGVRVAFTGHDLHGLTLGPDGRLYFSIGDRGFNVTTKEGRHLHMPDRGAVFRCELDGSQLEIFASGLRNPQELAFDDFGNLFTGDNNSDGADQARWVYVVEGGESGWRQYYQYLSDRGPWTRERMWYPYRADAETTALQPAYIVPPVAWLANGPSGLTRYPGLGLSEKYQGHFFLADFRGSAANSGVRTFAMEADGASFKLVDSEWFIQSVLLTDVDFGYDGRVYGSDWVNGWTGEGKGRIYSFTDPKHQADPRIAEVVALMKDGLAGLDNSRLVSLLAHVDQRIRLRAQYELADRSEIVEFAKALDPKSPRLARIHATWGLGQIQRGGGDASSLIRALLNDADEEVRVQAMRIVGDCKLAAALPEMLKVVESGTPREQSLAAIAIGKLGRASAAPTFVDMLRRNNDVSPVLRHAAVMGLVGCATSEELGNLTADSSAAVRLGAVVALRRMRSPLLAKFLGDAEARVVTEAARAIYDLGIEEAAPALAELKLEPQTVDALARRILAANFRLGQTENAARVADVAADSRQPNALRLIAVQQLSQWGTPPNLDNVTNEYRPIAPRSAELAAPVVKSRLPGMLVGSSAVLTEALKLAGTYRVTELQEQLAKVLEDKAANANARREAFSALVSMDARNLERIITQSLDDADPQLRALGLAALAQRDALGSLPRIRSALYEGSMPEAQESARLLGTLRRDAADAMLAEALDAYLAGRIRPEAQLDLLEAAALRPRDAIVERLAKVESSRPVGDPLATWKETLSGGSAARGAEIFLGNAAASCRRCHKVNGSGSDVGPDLSGIARENTREFLLESIVLPSAKIAKGYETAVFALTNGQIVSGIVRKETADSISLVQPTGEVRTVLKSEIEEQSKGKSGMPEDFSKQLTKRQIRDVVEYLSTLKAAPAVPPAGH